VTITRLLLTPVFLIAVLTTGPAWSTFAIGFVLAVTDGLDGYIARRQGATRSGAFLDPLADKFLVVGGLWSLVATDLVPWWPVAIISARELIISLYRSWAGRNGITIPARYWAKVKTVVQEFSIAFAVLPLTADHPFVSHVVLAAAVVLTVVTGAQYLLDGSRVARAQLAAGQ
jgi:CDP-diacylglycerol--glycerol-3-phosphate 3-phosphatidyltransferase